MNPIRRSALLALAAFALSGLAAGCGGSTSGSTGSMSVHLVDAPGDYLHVSLDVQTIEIQSGTSGWIVLGHPNKVIDLLALVNGLSEELANGASLPAGHYDQMRLVLGTDNTVTLSDGSVVALKVPSGSQSGLKFPVSFDVAAGTTKDVFIDFDAHKSIFVHEAGRSGKYLLRPVVRAVDRVVTGSISGLVTDATTHAPLAGAVVTAQQLDTTGTPVVVRTALTQADGSFQLDLLPVNASYYVVTQPVVGGTSYEAKASGPQALTAAAPLPTVNLACAAVSATGSITGAVTPAAGDADADAIVVRQRLDAGTLDVHPFVVRVTLPTEASGVETYTVDALPPATYGLVLERRTVASDGTETTAATASVDAAVLAGAPITLNFTAP
ncbi:DUF4382 domain-containing protein [Anaeromyxobacter paludicola]|uniref:DUF4382 domain-containing protein n=1 Tax=Anaeromyxobacter paludicola TaxID=2918171 RepID=A0ABN6NC81_9BACT|nr:DUF4382 domain-containing protein [Anaeromyxobacter paludicola]BDG09568.1 hypothetical protein AMPC_26810 [Anaeromyxobacter paludicola]